MAKSRSMESTGQTRMIDVTPKPETEREAVAKGKVNMKPSTLELIRQGGTAKGDVLTVAQTAGIVAAKETPRLIPLCHPVPLTHVAVDFHIPDSSDFIEITATVKSIEEQESKWKSCLPCL